jgi:hypothetical protein
MSTSATEIAARASDVAINDAELTVSLTDGRTISVPIAWFPRLVGGSAEALARWELLGDGEGIHWPDLDEDLSVAGLLRGTRAPKRKT